MYNVGLLGAGAMARKHAAVLSAMEGACLAAVGGGSQQTTGRLAEAHGARTHPTIETLIQDPQLDVIDICLPTFLHERCIVQAAAAGKHIICEKPLALTAQEAQTIAKAVRASGVHFMVAQVLRFWPEYVMIREMLDSGILGQPLTAYAARLHDDGQAAWMREPEKGGGAALDLHIHDLDFLYSLFGRPQAVYASGTRTASGVWDHVYTHLNFGQVQAVAEASYLYPRAFPFSTVFRLVGTKAALVYRSGLQAQDAQAPAELILYRPEQPPETLSVPALDPYQAELAYFIGRLEAGCDPDMAGIDEALEVLDIALAVQDSLASKEIIHFPSTASQKEEKI